MHYSDKTKILKKKLDEYEDKISDLNVTVNKLKKEIERLNAVNNQLKATLKLRERGNNYGTLTLHKLINENSTNIPTTKQESRNLQDELYINKRGKSTIRNNCFIEQSSINNEYEKSFLTDKRFLKEISFTERSSKGIEQNKKNRFIAFQHFTENIKKVSKISSMISMLVKYLML